jgi:hypothetical protein
VFDNQVKVFSVSAAQGVVFTILDDLGTPRVVSLLNMSTGILTCQYEYSDDGGTTWTSLGSSFDLDPAGSGGSELDVQRITQTGRIRLKASGGASARELHVQVTRTSLSSSSTFPLLQC